MGLFECFSESMYIFLFLENVYFVCTCIRWKEGWTKRGGSILFSGSKGVFLFSVRLIAGPVTNHDSSGRERRGHTTLGSVSGACCLAPLRLETPHPPAQLLRFATKSAARDRRRAAALYLPATSSSQLPPLLYSPVIGPIVPRYRHLPLLPLPSSRPVFPNFSSSLEFPLRSLFSFKFKVASKERKGENTLLCLVVFLERWVMIKERKKKVEKFVYSEYVVKRCFRSARDRGSASTEFPRIIYLCNVSTM